MGKSVSDGAAHHGRHRRRTGAGYLRERYAGADFRPGRRTGADCRRERYADADAGADDDADAGVCCRRGGAQDLAAGGEIVLTPPRDLNSELRHRTWSVYTQGGLSWATGVWYRNLDAKRSYRQSAAAGGGVDFTIRPWVRVGAEYIWSRYRREQRLSALDAETMPVKAYGNYMMNLHNAKLGVGLNLMEIWPERRAQWLNIWAGTGAGYTFGRGNEYGIHFSNTLTQGGQTTPLTGGASISNDDAITITGNVRTTNRHERFNAFYIPASLHVEADLCRRLTVGLKGEADWLLNRGDIAPKGYAFALVTLRYNLVPSRARVQRAYYEGEISALGGRLDALRLEADRTRRAPTRPRRRSAWRRRGTRTSRASSPTARSAGPGPRPRPPPPPRRISCSSTTTAPMWAAPRPSA